MRKGFTLIEMMIVVAIIAIIAAIAIPSLLAARRSSLETNAVGSCHAYSGAQVIFKRNDWSLIAANAGYPAGNNYADTLVKLYSTKDGNGQDIRLIDQTFSLATVATSPKHGYYFGECTNIGAQAVDWVNDYALWGLPVRYGRTGYRSFIVSTEGTVFAKDQGPAGAAVATFPADPAAGSWTIAE